MIPSRRVFDEHAGDYDRWFDEHYSIFQSQLRVLGEAVPHAGRGLEVGTGSGRFAVPLGICMGIDTSRELLRMAKERGIEVVLGEGEHLPYRTGSFDYVLMMTVVCFIDDPVTVFREVWQVLTGGGNLIVGLFERDGEIATRYRHEKTKGMFLRFAVFRTADEVGHYLEEAGFSDISVIRRVRGFCVMSGQK